MTSFEKDERVPKTLDRGRMEREPFSSEGRLVDQELDTQTSVQKSTENGNTCKRKTFRKNGTLRVG